MQYIAVFKTYNVEHFALYLTYEVGSQLNNTRRPVILLALWL